MRSRGTRSERPSPLASRESGQALLELALVVPILVLLMLSIFQFAFVIESQIGLTNAVREAARRAAASPVDAPTWMGASPAMEGWTQEQLCGSGGGCSGGLLAENVQAFDPSLLTPSPPTIQFCRYMVGSVANYRVIVAAHYQHPVFFGLLTFATDAVDGNPNGAWDLTATAEMRMENIDSATASNPGDCPP